MSEDRLFLPSFHDLEKTLKRLQPRDRMRMRTMLDRDLQELRSELSDAREDDVAALVNGVSLRFCGHANIGCGRLVLSDISDI